MGDELKTRTLKLKNVEVDPAIQPRAAGLDDGHVADLEAAYRAGAAVPPPRVVRTASGTLWLSRGFHRVEAAKRAGLAELAFEVVNGDRKDAVIDAACSNTDHGLKRTNADKRRAVEVLLGECPEWSDGKIAQHAGVSHTFVAGIRTQLATVASCDPPAVRVGKDGKARKVKPKPADKVEPLTEEELRSDDLGRLLTDALADAPRPADVDDDPDDTPLLDGGEEQAGGGGSAPADSQPGEAAPAVPPAPEADPAAESLARVETLCRDMDQIAGRMKGLKADRYCYAIHVDSAVAQVEAARKTLWQGRAAHPCPYCEATGEAGCKACNGTTRVKRTTRDSGREAMGGRK